MPPKPGPSSGAPAGSDKKITLDELKTHNTKASAWLAVKGSVYDVTEYANKHPGGFAAIAQGFGTDATKIFNQAHSYVNPDKVIPGKKVGVLQ